MLSSPSKFPAGQKAMPVSGSTTGIMEPQLLQNVRLPYADDW